MFEKIVAIEPVNMLPEAEAKLKEYAKEVVLFPDIPQSNEEIIRRIGSADAALVSWTSRIDRSVIEACKNLKYIGMCCSLYSPESANVDILAANENGITVCGIRDYGDPGVAEYVVSELVRYLHGFGLKQWKEDPMEITGLQVGIIGLGTTGMLLATTLQSFGAEVSYYSRTRKVEAERNGIAYRELPDLLQHAELVCTCLNKNVILLGEAEFRAMGDHKILFNTSIGPGHDAKALAQWLSHGSNEFFTDTVGGVGDVDGTLLDNPHVNCMKKTSGTSLQSKVRLGEKVLENIANFMHKA